MGANDRSLSKFKLFVNGCGTRVRITGAAFVFGRRALGIDFVV